MATMDEVHQAAHTAVGHHSRLREMAREATERLAAEQKAKAEPPPPPPPSTEASAP